VTNAGAPHPGAEPSTKELVGQLSGQVSRLVRDELRLAQIELTQKAKRAGVGTGLIVTALLLGFFVLASLVSAAIAAWALILPVWAAALIVAGCVLVLAALAGLVGLAQVKRGSPPIPEQAVASVRDDVAAVKGVSDRDIGQGR
jgi:uncharacterized membrane protein YqjE